MTPLHSIHGRGPVRAIALHGWFGDRTAFDSVLAAIDPERFTIALPDLRGYGAARPSDGPFDLATVAADTIALADRLGWDRFSLIGHSMGGKAALKAAIAAPDRVERLVGITPVWASAAPFDADTLAFFRSAADLLPARRAIIDLSTGNRLPPVWISRVAERSFEISEQRAFAGYLDSWVLEDFADQATGLAVPTLVIAGAHDQGVPEAWLRDTWLTALANCRLEVLADSGHYPADECPLILARRIADFLAPADSQGD